MDSVVVTLKQDEGPTIFLVHPIEGSVQHLTDIAGHLHGTVYGLQCSEHVPVTSVPDMAAYYVKVSHQQVCFYLKATSSSSTLRFVI